MEKTFKYAELNQQAIFGGTLARFSNLFISVRTDLALRGIIQEWQKHSEAYTETYKKIIEQAKAEFPKAFDETPDPKQLKKMNEKYNPMVEELGNTEIKFEAKPVTIDADELQTALENEKTEGFRLTTPHYIAIEDFIIINATDAVAEKD